MTVPEFSPYGSLVLPEWRETTLPTGLRVVAARRPVPLTDIRLSVPMAAAPAAPAVLLGETLLAGTRRRTADEIRAELRGVGGQLVPSVNADSLMLSGMALSSGTETLLDVLADALSGATYPDAPVHATRARVAQTMRVSKSQPALAIHEQLNGLLYPGHPYGEATPDAEQVLAIGRNDLTELHAQRVRPAGSTLVLVSDLDPVVTLGLAGRVLARWDGTGATVGLPPTPPLAPGPVQLVHRPGSVQSSVRIALPGVGVRHPDFAALQLANIVLGGYFSSRLVENLRERNGYTYTPGSMVLHTRGGSKVIVALDVANEVTAAALRETREELETLSTRPIDPVELDRARRYALGGQRLSLTSHAGVADLMIELDAQGAGLDWVGEHVARLETVTEDEVTRAAKRYLAPENAVTVVLSDADAVHSGLSELGPVVRR
ncbi:peptidase M16 [Amycolatopsis antarctica]|uniref:Peptidase M16 n=1 Tax=Amycolatopsis antarctica TaxID=1854586 RepID=A0A263D2P0_9PSEU|nr:pitrilysin family protein [Amycolatopsis antarctica]OZM72621.1 peptidase M16 [Amycolatopsis antarctica]